jgi:hypothetical protein
MGAAVGSSRGVTNNILWGILHLPWQSKCDNCPRVLAGGRRCDLGVRRGGRRHDVLWRGRTGQREMSALPRLVFGCVTVFVGTYSTSEGERIPFSHDHFSLRLHSEGMTSESDPSTAF